MKLPQAFLDNMKEVLSQSELDKFVNSMSDNRHYGLRVNTLKISVDSFLRISSFEGLEPVAWCDAGFYYNAQETAPLGKNPFHSAGLYYIQEPSAMSAVHLLDVKPGERVLDLCASPGGKSTQIASALGGAGLLVSNDANFSRMPQLMRNVEMAGITNAIITCETPKKLATRFEGYFDKVLVDAPCSGEGMFRKDPASINGWDAGKPARLADIQQSILFEAAKMVKGGGYMVYSTCTFNKTENEDVIAKFLSTHKNFECVKVLRIFPHTDRGEGHFAVLLRNNLDAQSSLSNRIPTKPPSLTLFDKFCSKYNLKLPSGEIFAHDDKLFIAPHIYPNMQGLQVLNTGLTLGTIKKQRFEPSYGLALALQKTDFSQVVDFAINDPNIARFLKGETFEVCGADGYNLMCIEGYPIGFGKLLKNRLKGHIK